MRRTASRMRVAVLFGVISIVDLRIVGSAGFGTSRDVSGRPRAHANE
jgi:hypothetical protein